MTETQTNADRLRRIIRVLTNWINKGERKGRNKKFVFVHSVTERQRTAERIEEIKRELERIESGKN